MTDWQLDAKCAELAEDYDDPDNPDPTKRSIWFMFFEGYESDPSLRPETNAICASCPVRRQCLEYGLENKETGVYGGVYLNRGHVDENKNADKTKDEWQEIKDIFSV